MDYIGETGAARQPLQLGGIFSGLDTNSLINRLVEVQSYPLVLLQQETADITSAIATYQDMNTKVQTLQSKLRGLQSSDSFSKRTTSLTDSTVMTATAGKTAIAGTHSFIVKSFGRASTLTSSTSVSFLNLQAPLTNARFSVPVTGVEKIRIVDGQEETAQGGSFNINGVTIDYFLDETLDEIITRINDSDANVTAAYDPSRDRFTLTSTNQQPISVSNLEGNLMSALKLVSAAPGMEGSEYTLTSTGTLAKKINPSAYLTQGDSNLSGTVGLGSFKVNGFTINVTATDTLNSIINKINGEGTNAIASFDQGKQKFSIRNKTFGSVPVSVTDDTSGLIEALKLTNGQSEIGNQLNIEMDGDDYFYTSNTVTDLLEDVTLNFLKESPEDDQGEKIPVTLTIGRDSEVSKEALLDFVDAYNEFIDFYKENTAGPKYEGTTLTKEAGPLISDNNLKWMVQALKRNITLQVEDLPSGMNDLSDVGVMLGRYGDSAQDMSKLYVDEAKLDEALAGDPDGVAALFTTEGTGLAATLQKTLESFTNATYGSIPTMLSFYNQRIDDINRRMDNYRNYLTGYRNSLVNQFMQMETMMAKIQSQGTSLATSLQQLLNQSTGND
jgi:flagellar hook-associated protein 2